MSETLIGIVTGNEWDQNPQKGGRLSSESELDSVLSRRKVYSILYSSTLILPSNRRGERLLRLLLLLTVVEENKKRYYYMVEYREYI